MSWIRIEWRSWSVWCVVPPITIRGVIRIGPRRGAILVLRVLLDNLKIEPPEYQAYLAKPLALLERGQMSYGRTPAFMSQLKRELKGKSLATVS